MSSALETAVRQLRRRIAFGTWVRLTAQSGALLAVLGGALVLLARGLLDWPFDHAAWLLAPVALAPVWALARVRGRQPSEAALVTWLDLSAGAHGGVVTSIERPDPSWTASIERELAQAPEPPAVPLGGPARRLFLASAFALAALFVPLARPAPGPGGTLFEQLVSGLQEKLEALDEVVELDEETAAELTERLGRLSELADEQVGREGLLESIDALSERLDGIAEQIAESGLDAADALAAAARQAASNPDAARDLLQQALSAIDEAGLQSELPAGLLALARRVEGAEGSGLQLREGFELSAERLQEWSEAMRQGLSENLDALSRAGLAVVSELELARMARSLAELVESEHVCDAECKAGGT